MATQHDQFGEAVELGGAGGVGRSEQANDAHPAQCREHEVGEDFHTPVGSEFGEHGQETLVQLDRQFRAAFGDVLAQFGFGAGAEIYVPRRQEAGSVECVP